MAIMSHLQAESFPAFLDHQSSEVNGVGTTQNGTGTYNDTENHVNGNDFAYTCTKPNDDDNSKTEKNTAPGAPEKTPVNRALGNINGHNGQHNGHHMDTLKPPHFNNAFESAPESPLSTAPSSPQMYVILR